MKKPETAKAMRERHEEQLARAYATSDGMGSGSWNLYLWEAEWDYKKIRAAIYATTPGRQKARNIGSQLDKAVTAACRVIRRG